MAGDQDLSISDQYRVERITFDDIRTKDAAMRQCLKLAQDAAPHDIPVLILGENGTGKNLVAQAIHTASPRREKPFLSVNCSALPEALLESELFGHERGAFTSADRERRGKFELAAEGTLFLDEIGDLSEAAQAKLLRVAEYGQFERVGGERTHSVDVRLVTATNRDLPLAVSAGTFRQDLFYRLRGVMLRLPPLRERVGDLADLAALFLQESARKFHRPTHRISTDALARLRAYAWPGNVRELKMVIASAVLACHGDVLEAEGSWLTLLDPAPVAPGAVAPPPPAAELVTLAEMERRHIEAVLRATEGNKAQAARLLDIARPTLDRKILEYGIPVPRKGERTAVPPSEPAAPATP